MDKTTQHEVYRLLSAAMDLIVMAAPKGPALTKYGNLSDVDKSVVNAISIAQGRMEEKKLCEVNCCMPLPSSRPIKGATAPAVKKWGNQNLRISKAVDRMSKKGFACQRG